MIPANSVEDLAGVWSAAEELMRCAVARLVCVSILYSTLPLQAYAENGIDMVARDVGPRLIPHFHDDQGGATSSVSGVVKDSTHC